MERWPAFPVRKRWVRCGKFGGGQYVGDVEEQRGLSLSLGVHLSRGVRSWGLASREADQE